MHQPGLARPPLLRRVPQSAAVVKEHRETLINTCVG
jgi:hypothetical protein